jgi:hypothetical protein
MISLPRNGSERHSESLFLFFVARKGIRVVVSFAEWFGMVQNGIPRICIYFCSTERNSELCSLPQNGSEQNYGSFVSIFVPRNGIPRYFLFRGRVRNGIPWFFVPWNNQNSVGNNHLFRLFRLPGKYFFVGNSQP